MYHNLGNEANTNKISFLGVFAGSTVVFTPERNSGATRRNASPK